MVFRSTIVLFALALIVAPAASAASFQLPESASSVATEVVGAKVGDTINGPDVFIEVPSPGHGIVASSGGTSIRIENNPPGRQGVFASVNDGRPEVGGSGKSRRPTRRPRAITSNGECTTNGYIRLAGANGPAWPFNFAFRASSANKPGSVNMAGFSAAVASAVLNWTTVNDNCGFSDTVGLSSSQSADTTSPTAISVNGSGFWGCPFPEDDLYNEMGWAYASGTTSLALACGYYTTYDSPNDGDSYYDMGTSDATLNTRYVWANAISQCTGQYLTENTLTHEAGHQLGLDDLTPSNYAPLTMYYATNSCYLGDTTLGLGDFNGISSLY